MCVSSRVSRETPGPARTSRRNNAAAIAPQPHAPLTAVSAWRRDGRRGFMSHSRRFTMLADGRIRETFDVSPALATRCAQRDEVARGVSTRRGSKEIDRHGRRAPRASSVPSEISGVVAVCLLRRRATVLRTTPSHVARRHPSVAAPCSGVFLRPVSTRPAPGRRGVARITRGRSHSPKTDHAERRV